ncbi:MAG: phosphate ABC transporter permease subunit PstC [Candidatus Aquicultor sp.]|nr:phosphate ABC transporter permease subunit PstC [Candidatus Aquicultor sp.]
MENTNRKSVEIKKIRGVLPSSEALFSSTKSQARWYRIQEKIIENMLLLATIISSTAIFFIILFVAKEALSSLKHNGLAFFIAGGWDQHIQEAWFSETPKWDFGALPLILGTFLTTGGALLLTFVLGTGCAIFLAELAPDAIRRPVEAMVRLLAGIPSVIFGLIGLMVVVPFIMDNFISNELALKFIAVAPLDGQSLLAGVIVLTFMVLPFYVTVATDAIRAVPKPYKEASLALGVTQWRSVTKVLIPVAIPGIVTGMILASARAVGEAIALSMVSGGMAFIPDPSHGLVFFLEPVRVMASAIIDNKEAMSVKAIESALFGVGTILLFISILLSLTARLVFSWYQKQVMAK